MKKFMMKGLAFVVLLSMSGCQKQTEVKEEAEVYKPAYSAEPYVSTPYEEEYVAYVDMSAVIQDVVIDGKTVEFPMKLEVLGDDFTYSNIQFAGLGDERFCCAEILKGDIIKAYVELFKDGAVENAKIYELRLNASAGIDWRIKQVTFGSNYEQIIAAFGEPSLMNGETGGTCNVYYENSSDELLVFGLEGGQVTSMILRYIPAEWWQQS